MKYKVKICGMTRPADALLAFELGAFAVGFVMCTSPRRVSVSQAKVISDSLPESLLRIGVYQDPTRQEIDEAVTSGAINGVQLHGEESPQLVQAIKKDFPHLYLIKRLYPEDLHRHHEFPCEAILMESRNKGEAFSVSRETLRAVVNHTLFMAGGITPFNVLSVIEEFRPDGIDLARGVETHPGIKDPEKMRDLFSKLEVES